MNASLKNRIEEALGEEVRGALPGTGRITTASGKDYFLKSGAPSDTYRCEANGLRELAKAGTIRIARVAATDDDYILTEYIRRGTPSPSFHEDFGKRFAQMHRYCDSSFGFYEDNFIGANPQLNLAEGDEKSDWAAFFFNKRLLYQYRMAERNGYATSALRSGFARLEARIDVLLGESIEPPTLLHGDLWSGNYLCDADGEAILIDPAVYYGHREADLAMTKVFGGFSSAFYKSYMEEYPLSAGWEQREPVYKLYHILNHLNIFGRGYLAEAEYLLSKL